MPNWCNNIVSIEGPICKISPMWKVIQEQDDENGFLNQLVPMPAQYKDGDGWYDWRCQNWGTKWDIDSECLSYDEDEQGGLATISGSFQSAWSPPVEAYNTFLEQNEDCQITSTYVEEGCDFAGVYENGVEEFTEDYHKNKMDVVAFIKKIDETDPVFQKVAERINEFDCWFDSYDIDEINEYRVENDLPSLEEEEWEKMCDEFLQ